MRAKEVLRLLRISRPTLYRYRKEGIITAQKLPSGFYDYHEEDVYRLVNKDIQRKTYLYARVSTRKQKSRILSHTHDIGRCLKKIKTMLVPSLRRYCNEPLNTKLSWLGLFGYGNPFESESWDIAIDA